MNMWKPMTLALAMLMIFSLCVPALAEAADDIEIEGVEVKFLIDPAKVLDADNNLTEEVLEMLGFTGKVKNRGMQFMETEDRAFGAEGWINRIRIKQGDEEYDLTYRKRYRVEDGDIAAALAKANADGLNANAEGYEAELDWGYNNLTLTISTETSVPKVGYDDTVLPNLEDSIAMISENVPELVRALGLDYANTVVCGPVYYPRYTGELAGLELDIEICPVTNKAGETKIICEVAFSVDTYEEAAVKRDEVTKILEDLGILLKEDGLKTQTIINAYLGD